ncbi:hypothetical protein ACQP00_19570 [Dactylosporangium sp. CS-047395]|uniref:hypothetical protein n=1 Tax=Dactylosporangium sp. CS-047395 TaxID=3239936 RepID=UPI003D8FE53D
MIGAFARTRLDEVLPSSSSLWTASGSGVDTGAVRIRRLRTECRYTAAGAALPKPLIEAHRGANAGSRAALPLLAHLCFDAVFIARGLGDTATAGMAADRCARAARLFGHPLLLGAAGFAQAHAASRRHSATRTLLIAEACLRQLPQGHPPTASIRGMLHLTAALAAARSATSSWSAVSDHLEEAHSLARLARGTPDAFGLSFGSTNVRQWMLRIALDRGADADADRAAAGLQPRNVWRPSRRCALYIDLARLHALRGRPTEAVQTLVQAQYTAPEYFSSRSTGIELIRQLCTHRMPSVHHRQLRRIQKAARGNGDTGASEADYQSKG